MAELKRTRETVSKRLPTQFFKGITGDLPPRNARVRSQLPHKQPESHCLLSPSSPRKNHLHIHWIYTGEEIPYDIIKGTGFSLHVFDLFCLRGTRRIPCLPSSNVFTLPSSRVTDNVDVPSIMSETTPFCLNIILNAI